jgi:transcriptional regulator with XRE-family HTH domain
MLGTVSTQVNNFIPRRKMILSQTVVGYKVEGMKFSEKLRQLMEERRWELSDLALACKRSYNTIHNWVERDSVPKLIVATQLAKDLGVAIDWLCDPDRTDRPAPTFGSPQVMEPIDPRFEGLERQIPPDITRDQIVDAVLAYWQEHRPRADTGGERATPAELGDLAAKQVRSSGQRQKQSRQFRRPSNG